MGAYEVTQAQYENIMDRNPATFRTDQNPVENASWEDAVEFCRRLSEKEGVAYRLPTEAEWEYACRAGSTTPYYTGAKISMDQASYDKKETAPVGSFPPNGLGLFDMHGNVFEWCRDWYSPTYYQSSPIEDPQGTDAATAAGGSDWGETHVVRGGCWGTESDTLRSAFRGKYPPSFMSMGVGFRVVVSAPTP
jgi:formylglycine-generating enzyme required for sulfatase activity